LTTVTDQLSPAFPVRARLSGSQGAKEKHGFVLLPRRWVVERDFGWMSRFRRLARDQERLADVLTGFHLIAFTMLMWKQVFPILSVL